MEAEHNIAPLQSKERGAPMSDYKKLSLYCAETKKTRVLNIKKQNFASDDELDAYCRKLREENKLKNKLWKEHKIRKNIEDALGRELAVPSPAGEISLQSRGAGIHSPVIDLNLDAGTGNTICIFGSSKRGKTFAMMHLYGKYFSPLSGDKGKINTLFSGNPHLKIYKQDPNLLVSYGFGPKSAKYIQLQQYINVKTKNRYQFGIFLDDIVDAKFAPILNKMVLIYRNSLISSIMCLQYVYMLSKQNRSSVNHTLVFGSNTSEDSKNIIDALLKPYLQQLGLRSFAEQVQFYQAATVDHGFIYLDNIHNKMSLHRLPAPHF